LYFAVLGTLEVRADDGTQIDVAAPKRRALLAALLLKAGRPTSIDQLAGALWGGMPPPTAHASLHAHVARLRNEIGPDRIITVPGGYSVRLRPGELDIDLFEQRLEEGRVATETRRWDVAAQTLRAALSLWRGAPFSDADDGPIVAGGAAFAEATRLEELRLGALQDRIEADLELGRHRTLCGELEGIVSEHPLRENFWRQLMLALYGSGRQADALAAYRRLRATMVEELGVDPAPELQELEIRILRQDPSLAGPPTGSIQPSVQLPVARTSLVGRHAELTRAMSFIRTRRLLTLTGPGGVGKTRLAIVVAHAVLQDFPDGVLFVDLSTVRDPARVLGRIGAVTGGGDRPQEVIGNRRMLLVLDNFEQVIEAAGDVAKLLDHCPSLKVVVTSRAPLRVHGEQRLEVPPLADTDAAGLFEQRAEQALGTSALNRPLVDDIVGRLDGLPLAIELAAARLGVLAPQVLRDRLSDRLSMLAVGARDSPDRHRTLRETIAWSYGLLAPAAQAAFRRLSVLAGGFDLDAATAVAACDFEVFAELVEQSLVYQVGDRYAMLETIREFAAESLEDDPDATAAYDRHLAHFISVAWAARAKTPDGRRARSDVWLAMCDVERDNLRLAFDWAVERDDEDGVLSLFRTVEMYWLLIGAADEGERWGEAALRSTAGADPKTRSHILALLSEFPRFCGDPYRAVALKLESIEIDRGLGDDVSVSIVLDDLASVYATIGEFAKARDCLAESMAIYDKQPGQDPRNRVHPLCSLVEVALLEGRPTEAAAWMSEIDAIESGQEIPPDWSVQADLLRARVLRAMGDDESAEIHLRSAIAGAARIGFRMAVADAVDELAAVSAARRPDRAARFVGMADRLRAEARLVGRDPEGRARIVSDILAAIGEANYARLHAEGHALTLAAIVAESSGQADSAAEEPGLPALSAAGYPIGRGQPGLMDDRRGFSATGR
jgi:predicted ATPase/DNA-binding SARP family transcriptional activator